MKIRKIQGSERFDASLISAYCFHNRVDDPERERERIEARTVEDWGAFDEDGTLAARIINNKYQFYIDGKPVCAGGIGAVSTLPEYRNQGAIREIFRELLAESYRNAEVISTLFPFNHAFYRKQGYEVVTFKNEYELVPALLSGYRFDGTVKRWNPGEPADEYLEIYNRFAVNYNLSALRDRDCMLEHMKVEKLYRDRKFSYMFSVNGQNIAYLIFTDVYNEPDAILRVEECAWINCDGFYAILGFLARFDADYGTIKLPLPKGIDLLRIIQTPGAYKIKKSCRQDYMIRVINAKKLLETIRKPADCDFTIRVSDEIIKENNGVWRVTADGVCAADGVQPDLSVSQRALGQMAAGAVNLDEAMLRPDVSVYEKEEMLRSVFAEKKIFVGEAF